MIPSYEQITQELKTNIESLLNVDNIFHNKFLSNHLLKSPEQYQITLDILKKENSNIAIFKNYSISQDSPEGEKILVDALKLSQTIFEYVEKNKVIQPKVQKAIQMSQLLTKNNLPEFKKQMEQFSDFHKKFKYEEDKKILIIGQNPKDIDELFDYIFTIKIHSKQYVHQIIAYPLKALLQKKQQEYFKQPGSMGQNNNQYQNQHTYMQQEQQMYPYMFNSQPFIQPQQQQMPQFGQQMYQNYHPNYPKQYNPNSVKKRYNNNNNQYQQNQQKYGQQTGYTNFNAEQNQQSMGIVQKQKNPITEEELGDQNQYPQLQPDNITQNQ